MRIVDFHAHAFPDFLAERAIAHLEENANWKAETRGTVGELIEVMDRDGIEAAVVANIATRPEQAPAIVKWSLQVASDRIVPFASVHPDSPDPAADVRAVKEAGLKGIKLHPLYQEFRVDDERAYPLYEALEESGLVVLFHAGYDVAFGEDDEARPSRFVPVLDRFPAMRVVLAHFGGWKLIDEFIDCIAGRPVWIDTSFTVGFCTDAQRDAVLERHGSDRILFATDSPWGRYPEHVAFVRDFPISEKEKEDIFHGNADALLGIRAQELSP